MASRINFICEVCGTAFWRTEGTVKRMKKRDHKIRWCSRHCQGKWLGTNR